MSGWTNAHAAAAYELTLSKALYWHGQRDHVCRTLEDFWTVHLEGKGFERLDPEGPCLTVTWDGATCGYSTRGCMRLYEALSGKPTSRPGW